MHFGWIIRLAQVRIEGAQVYVVFLLGLLCVSTFSDDMLDRGWIFV